MSTNSVGVDVSFSGGVERTEKLEEVSHNHGDLAKPQLFKGPGMAVDIPNLKKIDGLYYFGMFAC